MNHTSSRLVPVQQTCPAPARAGARMRDDAERAEVAAAAHDRQVRRRGALRPQRRDVCRAAPLARQRHPYSGLACSARGKTRSASHVTQCLCGSCSGQAAQRSDLMQLAGRSWCGSGSALELGTAPAYVSSCDSWTFMALCPGSWSSPCPRDKQRSLRRAREHTHVVAVRRHASAQCGSRMHGTRSFAGPSHSRTSVGRAR